MKHVPSPPELIDYFAQLVPNNSDIQKRNMFGYPCFFINGNLTSGLHGLNMIMRLNDNDRAEFLKIQKAQIFEPMPGRPMKQYVVVPSNLMADKKKLQSWLGKSIPTSEVCLPNKSVNNIRRVVMQQVSPFIWFKETAEEAMNFYVATFPNSKIIHIERYAGDQGIPGEEKLKGKVLTGVFEIMGLQFMCLDGGPQFEMTGAISFLVEFDTQEELDKVWEKLLDGGKPVQCGWIVDKFGVTWQITPKSLGQMMSDPNATPQQKKAVTAAMMPMVKLDSAKLEAAFKNT